MKKRQAKQLVWQLTKGVGALDEELWFVYYRVPPEDFKLNERLWRWEVVLEFKGKVFFKAQLEQIENSMIIEDKTRRKKLHKLPYSINFETREIVIW